MISVMTSCKQTFSFFQLLKSSSKVKVWLFGRWYENQLKWSAWLSVWLSLVKAFYRAQMLCALNICLCVLHLLHPWDQLPFWNNHFISSHAMLVMIFFFKKKEDKQLHSPWMRIHSLPDGHKLKPFRNGLFRGDPKSTTNPSQSLERLDSLLLAVLSVEDS